MIAASCDLGTNTFRLLIAEIGEGRSVRPLCVARRITRLGGGAASKSRTQTVIRSDALDRARTALREFRKIVEKWKPEFVDAIATHIVREASNRAEFSALVRKELGCEPRVVPPEEEAEYALLGALSILQGEKDVLLMDIGGGSTEYILYHAPDIAAVTSTDLGVVTMTERYLSEDPPKKDEIVNLNDYIEKQLLEVYSDIQEKNMGDRKAIFAGTAGTVTTLAMMAMGLRDYFPEKINRYILTLETVRSLLTRVLGLKAKKRLSLPGLEKGREDVIVAGALLTVKSMEVLQYEEMIVSDGGILEGILLKGSPKEVHSI